MQPQQSTRKQTACTALASPASARHMHTRASASITAREPRAEAREGHSCSLCKAYASKQPARASAHPMHTRERSRRGTPTAGRGEEGTLEAASATHMHADSAQRLQHIICARASAAGEARTLEAAGRGEESTLMRPLQSTRNQAACNSVDGFSTSHAHTRERSERSTQAAGRGEGSTLVHPLQAYASKQPAAASARHV